ncbi:hypothetical protein CWI38_0014p0010 [Hamiltosporidium tvaerminnensis]|uniref:Uncharacterized protein n=1 Tax=Hamiltosporidium tvaerminnensis TaxID=1176355 RepID=A0A4Q9L874_9MICR|nr:hypothetical protein CWI37_0233p0010 [Hamiltosporidium tvaerminnensis]TBU20866.1 hypothetical protein CWI38_0014p0010 [Hamiltosporidium tvaerminnensis]
MRFLVIYFGIFLCSDRFYNILRKSRDEILAGSVDNRELKVIDCLPLEFMPIVTSSPIFTHKISDDTTSERKIGQNNNPEISQVSQFENIERKRCRSPVKDDFVSKRRKTYLDSTHLNRSSISVPPDIDISSIVAVQLKTDKEEALSIQNNENEIDLVNYDTSELYNKKNLNAKTSNKKSRRTSLNRQMGSSNIVSTMNSLCDPEENHDTKEDKQKAKRDRPFSSLKRNTSYCNSTKLTREPQSLRRKSENFASFLEKFNPISRNKKKSNN